MASCSSSYGQLVAIPATFWQDKYLKKEPWYDRRQNVFYKGKIVEISSTILPDGTNTKVKILKTKDVVWLTSKESQDFDFTNLATTAEILDGSDVDDDGTSQGSMTLATIKKRRNVKQAQTSTALVAK